MRKKIIHCVFEDQAVQSPDRVAVEYGENTTSYWELNRAANRLAHFLKGLGIGKEAVGLLFDASPGFIGSILAVLKAGGIFMPLNTAFPAKRLEMMVKQSEARLLAASANRGDIVRRLVENGLEDTVKWVLLVDDNLGFRLYDVKAKTLHSTRSGPDPGALPTGNPQPTANPDDSCYVLYTSGSTGQPKAIVGMHMSLAHFIHWERTEFGLTREIRGSLVSAVTFDPCLRDMFVPLCSGGTLCIPSSEERIHIPMLAAWLEKSAVQLIHIVPSLLRMLTGELAKSNNGARPLRGLRYVLAAGEPLYGKDVLTWNKVVGNGSQIANLYGPAETTLAKLFYRVNGRITSPGKMVPVGKPISNTVEMIMKNNRLCRQGEPGEVYIKTPFRTKGYFKNPGLTGAVFIQNPLHNDFEDIV